MKLFPSQKKKTRNRVKGLTLREFHQKSQELLLVREVGGLGDILMHRMMFEDIKKQYPDMYIKYACPRHYHSVVEDHPYIDELLESRDLDLKDYLVTYNTTTACREYECMMAPYSGKHRSDIWANHIGVELSNHDMHLSLDEESLEYGRRTIKEYRCGHEGPSVAFCPISAMLIKDLNAEQQKGTVEHLRKRGCFVFGLHTDPVAPLSEVGVPVLLNQGLREWMGLLSAADYVVAVDSAPTHFAGGIGKPQVAIFTFADGKVYGKYYKNFILVQKHRDNGDWDCGPCYNYIRCPKETDYPKPCLTEITVEMIADGIDTMLKKYPMNTTV